MNSIGKRERYTSPQKYEKNESHQMSTSKAPNFQDTINSFSHVAR
jgi:hypothetical protein